MTDVVTFRPGEVVLERAVVALGVFDGVHLGHQTLVRDTIALARQMDARSCVLTFDRDPDRVVTPDRAAPQLTTLEDKIAFLSAEGPDVVLIVPFDAELAALTPERFCTDVLVAAARPVACVVGHDFRFGARAAGDVATLHELGLVGGFSVTAHELVAVDGEAVTSSRIRSLVAAGNVRSAWRLLGRPHRLHGTVVRGVGRGRSLGAPTINLDIDLAFAVPAEGVYAGWATAGGGRYPAAISVGVSPSFADAVCRLEAHLIGFEGDLYGTPVTIHFAERLRPHATFGDPAALAEAIAADVRRAHEILGDEG